MMIRSVTSPVQMRVTREIRTTVGTIAPGSVVEAVPSGDGGWLIQLSLPDRDDWRRAVVVPADAVRVRVPQQARKVDARSDYDFARRALGYSHRTACEWIKQGYNVDERTLFRWGIKLEAVA